MVANQNFLFDRFVVCGNCAERVDVREDRNPHLFVWRVQLFSLGVVKCPSCGSFGIPKPIYWLMAIATTFAVVKLVDAIIPVPQLGDSEMTAEWTFRSASFFLSIGWSAVLATILLNRAATRYWRNSK